MSDLINRDEVIETLYTTDDVESVFLDLAQNRRLDYLHDVEESDVVDFARDVINAVVGVIKTSPAVDAVEVAHGHWIFEQDEKMSWCTKATCSNCRKVVADNIWISVDDAREEFISEKRYCERCGAKMDEVSE